MTGPDVVAVLGAGFAAGTINAVVGSGTLITFPVLLAIGYPPIIAIVSNTIGLVPGAVSGSYGYRVELAGQRRRLTRLGTASVLGGVTGALLLMVLPATAFEAFVPVLLLLACAMVVLQPWVATLLTRRRRVAVHGGPLLWAGIYSVGVYGGYFGAAQGVLAIALLGLAFDDDLQRLNAARNVLSLLVNLVSAVLFVIVAEVSWLASLLIAASSVLGAAFGARVGRRLPPVVLRGCLVVVTVVTTVLLVLD